jgi:hypothetical protein
MTRVLGTLLCVAALGGCSWLRQEDPEQERDDLAADQAQQQVDLTRAQTEERTRLEQQLAHDQVAAREEAQEDLAAQTVETQHQQAEAARETEQLNTLIARACTGVESPRQDVCPIERGHASARDITSGVAIRLDEQTRSTEEFQHRLDCYLARATIRGAPPAGQYPCMLDIPDVDVAVAAHDGRVDVELTSTHPDRVADLRAGSRVFGTAHVD